MKTYRVKCSCEHKFQDERYGKGVRVANPMAYKDPKSKDIQVRCTVCSKVHMVTR